MEAGRRTTRSAQRKHNLKNTLKGERIWRQFTVWKDREHKQQPLPDGTITIMRDKIEPTISVILPIYNMELFLERCLDSVLNNTYRNLEVICVDDGSKDGSLDILRRYEAADPRIVVIAKENGGVSSARNAGLDRRTGEYVCFVDPDDYVHPQYFELLLRAHLETGCAMIVGRFRKVKEDESVPDFPEISYSDDSVSMVKPKEHFKNLPLMSYCWGRLIQSKCIADLHFHEEVRFAEDVVFLGELWEKNEQLSCCIIDEELYYYSQREGSLVSVATQRDRLLFLTQFVDKSCLSAWNEQIYFVQTLKRLLSCRYYATHIYPDKSVVRECRPLFCKCLKQLKRSNLLSAKDQVFYTLSIIFPGLNWLYRAVKDPGMLKWEKAVRKKRREEKKKMQASV